MDLRSTALVLVTFFPLAGFIIILFLKEQQKTAIHWTALVVSLVDFGLALWVLSLFDPAGPAIAIRAILIEVSQRLVRRTKPGQVTASCKENYLVGEHYVFCGMSN